MKKKKKAEMYPAKTLKMQFHSPVAPIAACGEHVSFAEWLVERSRSDEDKSGASGLVLSKKKKSSKRH